MSDVRPPSLIAPVCVTIQTSWWALLSSYLCAFFPPHYLVTDWRIMFFILPGGRIMFSPRQPLHQCEPQRQLCSVGPSSFPNSHFSFAKSMLYYIMLYITFWHFCPGDLAEVQCLICLVRQKPVLLIGSLPGNFSVLSFLHLTPQWDSPHSGLSYIVP